jgi:23S rRNA (pseudouridine1915-N3)-methyltransferase
MKSGKITIAAVGKIKAEHWRAAQIDYIKRLGRFTQIKLTEVRDYFGKGSPDLVAAQKEGASLLEATRQCKYRIALCIQGHQLNSLEFASSLLRWIEQYRELAFIVGGPVGLSKEVIDKCQYRLTLSALTLPHELARIILLEQLYRAATIINRQKYHK